MTPYLDPLGLGEGVKVGGGVKLVGQGRGGSRFGVKGGGGIKVVGQGHGQGWGRVRVKVGGSIEGVMVGGLGVGVRGTVGFSVGRFEMKRKCS